MPPVTNARSRPASASSSTSSANSPAQAARRSRRRGRAASLTALTTAYAAAQPVQVALPERAGRSVRHGAAHHSCASMRVSTRVVTLGSAGSGEPPVMPAS